MKAKQYIGISMLAAWVWSSHPAQGQGQAVWVNRYNSSSNSSEQVEAMAVDGAGNVYVTGISVNANQDILTIKIDANGQRVWTNYYNGAVGAAAYPAALAVDGSGNVYVAGSLQEQGANTSLTFQYATIKYSPEGNLLWVARYQHQTNLASVAKALAVDRQGNVYVTGQSQAPGTGVDYATVKFDASGHGVWTNRYNGPGYLTDRATAIAVDDEGNVYVTGESNGGYDAGTDYATIKYNANGDGVWTNRYNGPGSATDMPAALTVDTAGNVYVTGTSWGGLSTHDFATLKYSAAGALRWVSRYNGPANHFEMARALAVDGAGNVYVTGQSETESNRSHYATVKYDANGQELWAARYAGLGQGKNIANALALDPAGNVVVTGESDDDIATLRYDANGNRVWEARYHTSDWDTGLGVAADLAGNVYMAGDASRSEYDDLDYVVIKYGQMSASNLPSITAGPHAQTAAGGANAVLEVNATSAGPLFYQWYQDGNAIPNATNATWELAGVRWEDHGAYWVSVSNATGIVVSPEARVMVQVAPRFIQHPQSHYSGTGIFTAISGEAVGTPPLAYQWQHRGTNLPDMKATTLSLGGITPERGGEYVLIATNAFGAATSDVAVVSMELSAPLNTWEAMEISTNFANLRGIYHDRNGYVVVGNSGAIYTLSSGTNWLARNSGTLLNLHNIIRAHGLYIAVGSSGVLLTSPDLESWTSQNTQNYFDQFGMAAGGDLVVVVGDKGAILTSTNGFDWASQYGGTTTDLHGLAAGNGWFVAVGDAGVMIASTNGSEWSQQTQGLAGPLLTTDFKGVAWGGGRFVVVGELGTILTSPDGTNWTQQMASTTEDLNGVAYGGGVFTIVGNGQTGPGVILTSTDGVHWVNRNSASLKNLRAVTWGEGEFMVVVNDTTILQSGPIPKPVLAVGTFRPGAGMDFRVRDDIIRPYRIQASTNLQTWTDIFVSGATPPETNLVDTAGSNLPARFYRMVSP
jgi:hypothetical protein